MASQPYDPFAELPDYNSLRIIAESATRSTLPPAQRREEPITTAHDTFYLINAGPRSYSTQSDIDQQSHRDANKHSTSRHSRDHEQHKRADSGQSKQQATSIYLTDMLLRNRMREAIRLLRPRGSMCLDRAPCDASHNNGCSYPLCPSQNQAIYKAELYLEISSENTPSIRYHLACMEVLWQGKNFSSPLPPPTLYHEIWSKRTLNFRHKPPAYCLDGPVDESGHDYNSPNSKKQASLQPMLVRYGTSPRRDSYIKSGRAAKTKNTVKKQNAGYGHPIARFQHLAGVTNTGESLSEREKATVEVWKLASREQIDDEAIRRRSKMIQETLNGEDTPTSSGSEDNAVDAPPLATDAALNATSLREVTGLTKRMCYGKCLSEVLKMINGDDEVDDRP